jgi:hypothetical protein
MEPRKIVEQLMAEVAPNAVVAAFEERGGQCRVTIAGTTGVLADCDLPRVAVQRAEHDPTDRARVATALKRCADDVVARPADGRA